MKAKKSKAPDLSEYAEEKEPFDDIIRKLAHVKPAHSTPHKPARKAKKRAK